MVKNNLGQWDIKFLREGPFMPFGSLMNAYAQMHQQNPVDIEEFKKSAQELFKLAQLLVKKSILESQKGQVKQEKGPEFSIKNED